MTPPEVAVVTGAAAGIGAATARRLAAGGHHVVVADVDLAGARAMAAELAGSFVRLDVSRSRDWSELVGHVRRLGPLAVLHLNAGANSGPQHRPITSLDEHDLRRALDVNVAGVVLGTRSAVPLMPPGGSILVTASMAAVRSFPSDPVYAAAKHAQVGFVRSVAPQLARLGIRINVLCPGAVDTAMLSSADRTWLAEAGVQLLAADAVARGAVECLEDPGTGQVFTCVDDRGPRRVALAGPAVPDPAGALRQLDD